MSTLLQLTLMPFGFDYKRVLQLFCNILVLLTSGEPPVPLCLLDDTYLCEKRLVMSCLAFVTFSLLVVSLILIESSSLLELIRY